MEHRARGSFTGEDTTRIVDCARAHMRDTTRAGAPFNGRGRKPRVTVDGTETVRASMSRKCNSRSKLGATPSNATWGLSGRLRRPRTELPRILVRFVPGRSSGQHRAQALPDRFQAGAARHSRQRHSRTVERSGETEQIAQPSRGSGGYAFHVSNPGRPRVQPPVET